MLDEHLGLHCFDAETTPEGVWMRFCEEKPLLHGNFLPHRIVGSHFFFLGGLSSHVTVLDVAEHDDVDTRSSSSASLCFRFSDDDFSHAVKDIFEAVNGCFSGESEMHHWGGGGGGGKVSSKGSYSRSAADDTDDILRCQMLSLLSFLYLFFAVISGGGGGEGGGPQGPLGQIFNASLRVWLRTVRIFFPLSEALRIPKTVSITITIIIRDVNLPILLRNSVVLGGISINRNGFSTIF